MGLLPGPLLRPAVPAAMGPDARFAGVLQKLGALDARVRKLEEETEFEEDVPAAISPTQQRIADDLRARGMHRCAARTWHAPQPRL